MREKELRLALVCYGGISLAVYMHGITREIWHLARASKAFNEGHVPQPGSVEAVYTDLLHLIEHHGRTKLRVMPDIIAGASAGGINGIFLAQAISTGQSLEPLTDMWLKCADVEELLDPDARPVSRFSKVWAQPLAWAMARRKGGTVDRTVDPETQDEVSRKLSQFVRARWFEPPFGGKVFTNMLLDAFGAMAEGPVGEPLLPPHQPLDLFVTVTDFRGYPQKLELHSPPVVTETEHRLIFDYHDRSGDRALGSAPDLVFAARATASFPGAFPPFTVSELDQALRERGEPWADRAHFLQHMLPRQMAEGTIDETVLIDGGVLMNAPFGPALSALPNRPAKRQVDRRFVYIDPTPGTAAIGGASHSVETPGFFGTIFGALSAIPREQPIRDNLEQIAGRTARINRMRRVIDVLRHDVEEAVMQTIGKPVFRSRPTPERLTKWRKSAQTKAVADAGHAYAGYGHLKLAEIADQLATLLASNDHPKSAISGRLNQYLHEAGIDKVAETKGKPHIAIAFFREQDVGFRSRRLRFLARQVVERIAATEGEAPALEAFQKAIYDRLGVLTGAHSNDPRLNEARALAMSDTKTALTRIAEWRDLIAFDAETDVVLSNHLPQCAPEDRDAALMTWLGFPFYDIATLPMLQGEGLDEFDPVKVDRISPDDATSIRSGGAEATLKGVEFNHFGAFFSRAYRENDYLWGRLHGAERMVDIALSTLSSETHIPSAEILALKQRLFSEILKSEKQRLTESAAVIAEIEQEIATLALARDNLST